MNEVGTQAPEPSASASGDAHFRPLISMGLHYDVWLTGETLRLKQGLRKINLQLADLTHFGIKRLDGDRTALTELRLVTASKTHKLPFHTGDDQGHALLAALQARLPDADVSGRPWVEAAPLLGFKPHGIRDFFSQPLAAAGIVLLLLAPPAMMFLNNVLPSWSPPSTRGVAVGIVMAIGVVFMAIAYTRFRKRRAADVSARALSPST